MALLVAIPMCVCGHSLLPIEDNQKNSCCFHHEEDEQPTDSEHDCELCYHDQLSFLSQGDKKFLYQGLEAQLATFDLVKWEPSTPIINSFLRGPPPDCFSHSSRNITYCTYRL